MASDRRAAGQRGEELAASHLESLGWIILGRNLRTRWGELDLLADDGAAWVVVEVRTVRRAGYLGGPASSVTLGKARQVLRATRHYLARHGPLPADRDLRLDALGVELDTGRIEHLRGAIRWDLLSERARDGWR